MARGTKPISALKDSDTYKELLGSAGRAHRDTLRDILWLTNAHYKLVALPQVAANLRHVLEEIDRISDPTPRERWQARARKLGIKIPEWILELNWIEKHKWSKASDPKAIHRAFYPRLRKKEPLAGQTVTPCVNPILGDHSDRHPLYTALWETYANPSDSQAAYRYKMLVAQMLLGFVALVRSNRKRTRNEYETYAGVEELSPIANSLYGAFLSLRHLSEASEGAATYLKALPILKMGERFAHDLLEIKEKLITPPEGIDKAWHDSIALFFAKVYGLKKAFNRDNIGARREIFSGAEDFAPGLSGEKFSHGDSADPDFDWGWNELITRRKASLSEQREAYKRDDNPGEDDDEESVILSLPQDAEENAKAATSSGSHAKAWSQACHIEMANQLLPWNYNALSDGEMRDLLKTLMEHCCCLYSQYAPEGAEHPLEIPRHAAVMPALILTMLSTGSVLSRTLELRDCAGQPKARLKLPLCTFKRPKGTARFWWLPVLSPGYKTKADIPRKTDVPRASGIVLPDLFCAFGWFYMAGLLSGSGRVFHDDDALEEAGVQRFLSENLKLDARFTPARISGFLFRRITQVTGGDITAATLITGNRHPLARARLYYATPSLENLQAIYTKSLEPLTPLLDQWNSRTEPFWKALLLHRAPTRAAKTDGHVGSRNCPTLQAVRGSVRKLRRDLRNATLNDEKSIAKYHDLFTLYTVWTLGWSTGIRAIKTPYVAPQEVDEATGWSWISDKGVGYKSRLLWVPPFTRKQMRSYAAHLESLKKTWPDNRSLVSSKRPCFFLVPSKSGKQFRPIEVRPKTLTERMQHYLPYPVNVHRRFVRCQLLERGCPPEVVDVWMGHWHHGEEFWGRYSSFDYRQHRETLNEHVPELMSKLQIKPLGSRLCLKK